ncbi:tryptophan synthase subunit alpha [Pseudoxanthomonas suwonensis]|uniref:Tryptophan synthase alpha chain n=1 Tax=Pseudoxanthomonas suwonensis TaxID=314722 RepID=A0A0E3YYZ1_9GAMM|nr:tryptophan synthase subunit alpha [Pseudoxanthomonas suwonensis]AKC85664.1 tryptophan synthase alpha chain [Pseudoxanthomonas suwonensis]
MSRFETKFAQLCASGRKALIPFVTAGDPSLEATVPVMHALVEAGADAIELGVAFSDPMADGPVIQRSSERALARGAGTDYVFDCVRRFRERDGDTPVVLMGYLNPVEIRGAARFAAEAVAAGVDGVLLVDLPPEEAADFQRPFNQAGLALVMLAAPTTSPERAAMLCANAQGYLYYVSYAGVTGADRLDTHEAGRRLQELRAASKVPVVAGFGIKDAASAAAMAADADGVVVGSALVSALADASGGDEAAARAKAFLAPLRQAIDNP